MEETGPLGFRENPQELEKGWRSPDSTHKECAGAGLPTNRVERALHRGCPLTVLQNPSGATPRLCPLHTTSWHWIWSRQALGEDSVQGRIGGSGARGLGYGPGGAAAPVLVLTQCALQRQPRWLTAVQPLSSPRQGAPTPSSSLANAPPLPTPHHSLTLDHTTLDALTREIATRGGMQLGLCLSGAAHASRAAHQISVSTEPRLLQHSCPHWKGTGCLSPTLSTSAVADGEHTPPLTGQGELQLRESSTSHTAQVLRPPTPTTLPIKVIVASTP